MKNLCLNHFSFVTILVKDSITLMNLGFKPLISKITKYIAISTPFSHNTSKGLYYLTH